MFFCITCLSNSKQITRLKGDLGYPISISQFARRAPFQHVRHMADLDNGFVPLKVGTLLLLLDIWADLRVLKTGVRAYYHLRL